MKYKIPVIDNKDGTYTMRGGAFGEISYIDGEEFTDRMYYSHYIKDGCRTNFIFKSSKGNKYVMFISDLDEIIPYLSCPLKEIYGKWSFIKHGTKFGIKLIEELKGE